MWESADEEISQGMMRPAGSKDTAGVSEQPVIGLFGIMHCTAVMLEKVLDGAEYWGNEKDMGFDCASRRQIG